MKTELLSPVGNIEMLYQAIHNGADAVYLSGNLYGARKYAENFTNEKLKYVLEYSHLYGVKVYITVNTLIYNEEVNDFMSYVKYIHNLGVDALIMQDIGMIDYVKKRFPNIEIHGSTQCHINNGYVVSFLKQMGVSRVVFAREMSLNNIKKIPDNIEKEVFIHGALCVCYSGRCLFSSLNGGRSANRGECVACCRFPYKLIENGREIECKNKYLLSMKDLNTTDNINEILDSNITCLKIEGRMKSPEYVGYVTKMYRKLIDGYYNNQNIKLTNEEKVNIKQLYNRKFTSGFLCENTNNLNSKLQNNEGIYIGDVISFNKYKIKIKLSGQLNLNDGIKFYNQDLGMVVNKIYNDKNLLINKGLKNDIIYIDNKIDLKTKDLVYKTLSKELNDKLIKYDKKRIPIRYKVTAKKSGNLNIIMSDGNNKVIYSSNIVLEANNKATTAKDIIEKLSKLGDTAYRMDNIDISVENDIFIPISKINEIRRDLVKELNTKRIENDITVIENNIIYNNDILNNDNSFELNVVLNDENIINDIIDMVSNVYIEDYKVYLKYKHLDNVYYKTSGVEETYRDLSNCKIVASDLGAIKKYCNNNIVIGDYLLNVTNNFSFLYLTKCGLNKICLSCELSLEQINNFDNRYNIEVLIYGKIKLMSTKQCIKKDIIKDCSLCNKNMYYLKNKGNLYYIKSSDCITNIYDYKAINYINNVDNLRKNNIRKFRLDFIDESKEEIIKIINEVRKEIKKCIKED